VLGTGESLGEAEVQQLMLADQVKSFSAPMG
jgi:hypothetical protein